MTAAFYRHGYPRLLEETSENLSETAAENHMKSGGKLVWQQGEQSVRISFSIPYIGEVDLEVVSRLPGACGRETPQKQKQLALRYAKLLVRNFANALEQQLPGDDP